MCDSCLSSSAVSVPVSLSASPSTAAPERRVRRAQPPRPDPFEVCDHQWRPVPDWFARYHCERCGAYGRKLDALRRGLGADARLPRGVTPYRCAARRAGRTCKACAVVARDGEWLCPVHAGPAETRAAREHLARSTRRSGPLTQVLSTYGEGRAPRNQHRYPT